MSNSILAEEEKNCERSEFVRPDNIVIIEVLMEMVA